VAESLPKQVPQAVGLDWLRVFDLKWSWHIKLREAFTIEPNAAIYNLFNFANFDLPGNTQGGTLIAATVNDQQVIAPNHVGGTDYAHCSNQASLQSGTFALGAPRAFEWRAAFDFLAFSGRFAEGMRRATLAPAASFGHDRSTEARWRQGRRCV